MSDMNLAWCAISIIILFAPGCGTDNEGVESAVHPDTKSVIESPAGPQGLTGVWDIVVDKDAPIPEGFDTMFTIKGYEFGADGNYRVIPKYVESDFNSQGTWEQHNQTHFTIRYRAAPHRSFSGSYSIRNDTAYVTGTLFDSISNKAQDRSFTMVRASD